MTNEEFKEKILNLYIELIDITFDGILSEVNE